MFDRRNLLWGAGALVAFPTALRAQSKIRVGVLYPGLTSMTGIRVNAVMEGLREAGFENIERIEILARASEGDPARLAPLAADLVNQKVDAIVPISPSAVRAAKGATTTIPVVANDMESDPVLSNFVQSLSHPGGNITGVFSDFPKFGTKWIELLKEVVPRLSKVVIMADPASGPVQREAVQSAARGLSLQQELIEVRSVGQLDAAFARAREIEPDAIIMLASPIFGTDPKLIARLARESRLPIATIFSDVARAGGLLSYGPGLIASIRQTGGMLSKVLKGVSPADIPIERPTTFELVINMDTARALNLDVPASILARATEVID